MAEIQQFDLVRDKTGVVWDLLLYVPTVIALSSIGASFWFGKDHNMGYLLFFLACFFFFAGFNRIFKTRLMMLPTAPVSLRIGDQSASFLLRNNSQIDLLKGIKFYPDYAGKSFGISGLDGTGKQLQFVFHKGQFADKDQFGTVQTLLKQISKKT